MTATLLSALSSALQPAALAFFGGITRLSHAERVAALKAPDAFFEQAPGLMTRIQREADALDAASLDTAAVMTDLEDVATIDQLVDLLDDLRRALLDLRLQLVERSWRATLTWRHIAEGRAHSSPRHEAQLQTFQALFARQRSSRAAAAK